MKTYLLLIASCCVLFSCSRKTVPAKTNNATTIINNNPSANNNYTPVNIDSGKTITTDSIAANNSALAFIVITNGYGKIINQQNALPPDTDVHFDEFQLSKGFNAQQLSNLKVRYKTIPPRVLYVNPQNQQQSARGTFYVLGKKFWYWKKKDGLFYLDEKYYL